MAVVKKIKPKPQKRGRPAVRLTNDTSKADIKADAKHSKAEKIREAILSAALEYYGTVGFEGTTTRAIAERVGITHTLVLYHFKSKDRLWLAALNHILLKYGQELKESISKNREISGEAALKSFIEKFVRLSAEHPEIHRIMTSEGNQDTERLRWLIDNFLRDHFRMVIDVIKLAQEEGSVRDCDPARLYYLIIGVGGTPFTLDCEYKLLTKRDVFSEPEILRNIAFIFDIVFTP